jgi:16S rRNA processing protein RimM
LEFDTDNYVAVARVGKPTGLQGLCRLFSFGDYLSKIELPIKVFVGSHRSVESQELVSLKKADERSFRASFTGFADKDSVDTLKNHFVYIAKSELPETDENEYYFYQLTGLDVETETGETVGQVAEVFNFPTTDALEVKLNNGKKILFPFRKETIVTVILEERKIVIESVALEDLI